MIIWLNGTFGAGKTTTAKELTSRIPGSRLFDAEKVGEMLWHVLGVPERDFQEFPPWRRLVVEIARQVLDYVGGTRTRTRWLNVPRPIPSLRASVLASGALTTCAIISAPCPGSIWKPR